MTLPIPPFRDPFLEDVAESLRKRRKSLKHRSQRFDVYKVYETVDGETLERLETILEGITAEEDAILEMHVWQNRWVWLKARSPSGPKKAAWQWTYDGRALGSVTGRAIVAALELTHATKYIMSPVLTVEFTAIWKPLLARDPVEVR